MLRALARVCAVLVASTLSAIAAEAPPPEPVPFGVTSTEVAAERDVPQACFTFTDRLEASPAVHYRDYVTVRPADAGAAFDGTTVARDRSLCVDGLRHGQTYTITLREGLPGRDGKRLPADDSRSVAVPNRKPALAFRGAGYILPRIGADGLPLRTINLDRAKLQVLRITDRSLVEKIYFGRISQQMTDREVGDLLDRSGREVWRGEMAINNVRNQTVVTPFPIDAVLGKLEPGVYIAVASTEDIKPGGWDHKTTQWFVVSDLGLNTTMGEDALVVFARSVATADPAAGVEVRLLARDNSELGKLTTGPDGLARFDLAALRAAGRPLPQALFATRGDGDFGFLELSAPGQASGPAAAGGGPNGGPNGATASAPMRPAVGRADAFLYTERGIYRPGETVNLAALLRDADAKPVTGQTLSLSVRRPDGLEVERRPLADAGGGSYATRVELPPNAFPGTWTLTALGDGDGAAPIGAVGFLVEDFVPPRVDVALSSPAKELPIDGKTTLTVDGHFLYGAPAANLPGELSVTLRAAANPYPSLPGYRFGLAQEEVKPRRVELPGFTTDHAGRARIEVGLPHRPEGTRPLEAAVRATLLDIGGRPVSRELVLPVHAKPFAIGIRPRFDGDGVPEGATAGFDVVAAAPDGTTIDKADLSYELFEEDYDYNWFEANGRWDYKVTVRDQRVTGGTLSATADKPASVEAPVGAGRYRLEVFDPKTGVATSLRFAAGWWMAPAAGDRPDAVDVAVMMPSYKGGETAWVFVKPPYDSQVLITVADRRIRSATLKRIGPEGAFLQVPVDPDWTGGVYVLATAFATPQTKTAETDGKVAPTGVQTRPGQRAVGLSWLAVDPAQRTLGLRIEAPTETAPRQTVAAKVTVEGVPPGQPAYVTLAAVDDSVLQLTDQHAPDPNRHYLGKRPLAVELRDSYGRLIDPADLDPAGAPRTPVPRLRQVGVTVPLKTEGVVSLFSGIVTVGADGAASIPLTLPDVQGRLRLMAVAWSGDALGHAEDSVLVRDPVLADLGLPRALAPGDAAVVPVTLDNIAGPAGDYHIKLIASGAVSLSDSEIDVPNLTHGKRAAAGRVLTATGTGVGHVALDVTGPDGLRVTRQWDVTVRAVTPFVTRRVTTALAPGQTVATPADLTAGLRPDTAAAYLALGAGIPDIDVPGLLTALDRAGPDGLEASVSRALPLLALGDTAAALGVVSDAKAKTRVQRAVDRVLAFERPDGAFAMWSPKGEPDSWLTAYALDFLGRAKAAGYRVPDAPYRKGLDGLKARLDNAWVDADEFPGRAYALYVLARAKMIDAGAVRYFQETFWDKLQTDLARAQVAAATAALGDNARAADAFGKLNGARVVSASLRDCGSSLRDDAGVVALMAESGAVDRDRLTQAADRLAKTYAAVRTTSVQEDAWVLLAAKALTDRAPAMKIARGDQVTDAARPLFQPLDLTNSSAGQSPDQSVNQPAVKNAGTEPLRQILSVTGAADAPPDAHAQGLTLTRGLYDLTGRPVDPGGVRQNDRLVVVLDGATTDPVDHQALVTDLLPGGFEIETVRLAGAGRALGDLSWLGDLTVPRDADYRNDRFVAAVEIGKQTPRFRLAYLVRAVTPGDFALPGAEVHDLYRPYQSARGAAARLRVLPD